MNSHSQDTITQLRSMFSDFDTETLKTVLAANSGNVEKTIEDLLKMTSEAEMHPGDPDDDNLFAEPIPINKKVNNNDHLFGIDDDDEPQGTRFEDLGVFQQPQDTSLNFQGDKGDERIAKEMQEQEDAELAIRLQQEYLAQEEHIERQIRQRDAQPQPHHQNMYDGPSWNFSDPNSHQNPQYPQGGLSNNSQNQGSGDKKKAGFMNKMKTGFNNLFGTKKDSKKETKVNNQPNKTGPYTDIDNLEEQEVYTFTHAEPQGRNTGMQQMNNHNNNANSQKNQGFNHSEEQPLHLSDILHHTEENNQNYQQNNNYNYNNNENKSGAISSEHFGF